MRQDTRGLTLVEALTTLAILAVLAAVAVPSFVQMLDRQRVHAAAETLKADLQFLRTESQRRRETLYLTPTTGTAGSCYVLHPVKGACRCSADGTATCESGVEPLKVVAFPPDRNAQLTEVDPGAGVSVERHRGLFNNLAKLTITAGSTASKIVVSQFRSRSCTVGSPGC